MEHSKPQSWRATLTPHRSLSGQGFLVLMTILALVSFSIGLFFFLIGAWPVVGFMGLDVALIWWAFRKNFAAARHAERIEITTHEVVLEKLSEKHPPLEYRFLRAFVRIELEQDLARDLIGRLFLKFRGQRTEIASFLGAEERHAFAQELEARLMNSKS